MPKYIDADALNAELDKVFEGTDYGFDNDLLNAVLSAMDNAPAADVEPKREWIPVTERLPERFVEVLVVSNGSVIFGYLGYMGLWFTGINSTLGSVTHWMPTPSTPEPPKEEEDEHL